MRKPAIPTSLVDGLLPEVAHFVEEAYGGVFKTDFDVLPKPGPSWKVLWWCAHEFMVRPVLAPEVEAFVPYRRLREVHQVLQEGDALLITPGLLVYFPRSLRSYLLDWVRQRSSFGVSVDDLTSELPVLTLAVPYLGRRVWPLPETPCRP